MTTNPFATEAAWDVAGQILLARPEPYLCEITDVEQSTSSGGFPQLVVKSAAPEGSITDWIVVMDSTIGKVVQLTDAAGLERPTDEQVKEIDKGYALDPRYVGQLVGKKVAVVVRAEKDRNDPTQTRDRVAGYLAPDKASGATSGFSSAPVADDDIPF